MERKILSVLTVLIDVLMSTAALAACDKTPAEAESSGGSSDNLSTEQGGEPSVSESGGNSGAQMGTEGESRSESPFIFADGYSAVLLESKHGIDRSIDNGEKIFTTSLLENDSFLQIFDAKTGKLLSETDYNDFGEIMRIEAYSQKAGFDYRICFGDRIIYRSFNDLDKSLEEILPHEVSFKIHFAADNLGRYDITETAFAYENGDAIRLELSGKTYDILPENYFTSAADFLSKAGAPEPDNFQSSIYFGDPRFICGGEKLVVGVFSQIDSEYIGCAVYDIAEENFVEYIFCATPQKPVYPILDRFVYSTTEATLFDIETGKKSKISHEKDDFESFDYQNLIDFDFEMSEYGGFKDFSAGILNVHTGEEKPFFSIKPEYTVGYFERFAVTENFFIVDVDSSNAEGHYAVRYTG